MHLYTSIWFVGETDPNKMVCLYRSGVCKRPHTIYGPWYNLRVLGFYILEWRSTRVKVYFSESDKSSFYVYVGVCVCRLYDRIPRSLITKGSVNWVRPRLVLLHLVRFRKFYSLYSLTYVSITFSTLRFALPLRGVYNRCRPSTMTGTRTSLCSCPSQWSKPFGPVNSPHVLRD